MILLFSVEKYVFIIVGFGLFRRQASEIKVKYHDMVSVIENIQKFEI